MGLGLCQCLLAAVCGVAAGFDVPGWDASNPDFVAGARLHNAAVELSGALEGVDAGGSAWLEVIGLYQAAVEAFPELYAAQGNLGLLLFEQGAPWWPDALHHLTAAAETAARLGDTHEAAVILVNLGRLLEAQQGGHPTSLRGQVLPLFEAALSLDATPPALFNAGRILAALGDLESARRALQAAVVTMGGDHPSALLVLGNVLMDMGGAPEALEAYSAVLQAPSAGPKHRIGARLNSARVWLVGDDDFKNYTRAFESYAAILGDAVDNVDAAVGLLFSSRCLFGWERVEELEDGALRTTLSELAAGQPPSFPVAHLQYMSTVKASPTLLRDTIVAQEASLWGRSAPGRASPGGQLRVTALSYDMRGVHPVGRLMAPVVAELRADVVNYGPSPALSAAVEGGDPTANVAALDHLPPEESRVVTAGASYYYLFRQADSVVVDVVGRTLRADVVVDLTGPTQGGRSQPVAELARGGAMVVGFLGHPGSFGHPRTTFLVVDTVAAVLETCAQSYSETLILLPHSYHVGAPEPSALKAAVLGAARHQCSVTLGNFNSRLRVGPGDADVWAAILTRVPGACLMLREPDTPTGQRNLLAELGGRGINPARVHLLPRTRSRAAYFRQLRSVDLYVDTTAYNAHSTALDCLQVATPLVTLQGAAQQARVASSILESAGLRVWVVTSTKDLEDVAVWWASRRGLLASMRATLAQFAAVSPVLRPATLARSLQRGFQLGWDARLARASHPPHVVVHPRGRRAAHEAFVGSLVAAFHSPPVPRGGWVWSSLLLEGTPWTARPRLAIEAPVSGDVGTVQCCNLVVQPAVVAGGTVHRMLGGKVCLSLAHVPFTRLPDVVSGGSAVCVVGGRQAACLPTSFDCPAGADVEACSATHRGFATAAVAGDLTWLVEGLCWELSNGRLLVMELADWAWLGGTHVLTVTAQWNGLVLGGNSVYFNAGLQRHGEQFVWLSPDAPLPPRMGTIVPLGHPPVGLLTAAAPPPPAVAFATLVYTQSYIPGVVALVASLRLTGSTAPVVVLVPVSAVGVAAAVDAAVGAAASELMRRVIVKQVPAFEFATCSRMPRVARGVWAKLHLWGLVEYDTVVMLDADALVLKNLDHLFGVLPVGGEATAAFVAANELEVRFGVVSSGFIVLRPAVAVLDAMVSELAVFDRFQMCETDFFNVFFEHAKLVLPHTYTCIAEGLEFFYDAGALLHCHVIDFQSCGDVGWKPWFGDSPPSRHNETCRFPWSQSYADAAAMWRTVYTTAQRVA